MSGGDARWDNYLLTGFLSPSSIPLMLKEKLKIARTHAGMSMRQVGKEGICTAQYISQLEKGQRINPGLPILRKLAELYGCSPVDFLEE